MSPHPGQNIASKRSKDREGREATPGRGGSRAVSAGNLYGLAFGIFLGLLIIKFGNPIVLDTEIVPPGTLHEAWAFAWPPHWAFWFLAPLTLAGAGLAFAIKARWTGLRLLWMLPVTWFGWQLVSSTQTVDAQLTKVTVLHFVGCLMCYFSGAFLLRTRHSLSWLLVGLLAGFAFCLVRAANQRLFEFPAEQRLLLEGERAGWTNFPPDLVSRLKRENAIVTTNGIDVANPFIVAKYAKGRVQGTLMYPNVLAGAILLLWPVSIAVALDKTRHFRPLTRCSVGILTLVLGFAGLFWTGSKLGWLIAMGLAGIWFFHLNRARRWKWIMPAGVLVAGTILFTLRFHGYFVSGATSAAARLDYWRAAVQVVHERPWSGSGPGTFQRPYAQLRAPGTEMARLAHNDYLEQFSDSGIIGGMSYLGWILFALATTARRLWWTTNPLPFAIFIGVLGWFLQGLGEFSLYIPALAWTAFALLGWLVTERG